MRIRRDVQNRWSCPRARSWTRSRSGHPPSWARRVATDRKTAGRIITVSDGKITRYKREKKDIKKREEKKRKKRKRTREEKKRSQRREENRRVSWRRKEGRRGGEEKRVVSGTGPSGIPQ